MKLRNYSQKKQTTFLKTTNKILKTETVPNNNIKAQSSFRKDFKLKEYCSSTESTRFQKSYQNLITPKKILHQRKQYLQVSQGFAIRKNLQKKSRKNSTQKRFYSPMKKFENHFFIKKEQDEIENLNKKLCYSEKIQMNQFKKGEHKFYSNKITFTQVLKSIFYDQYRNEHVSYYLMHCFQTILNRKYFLEIFAKESNIFCKKIKKKIKLLINKIYTEEIGLQKYTLKISKYNYVIDKIFELFKMIENIQFEIEKITESYIYNYTDYTQDDILETHQITRSLLIEGIFKDSFIKKFIFNVYAILENSNFYSQKSITPKNQLRDIIDSMEFEKDNFFEKQIELNENPNCKNSFHFSQEKQILQFQLEQQLQQNLEIEQNIREQEELERQEQIKEKKKQKNKKRKQKKKQKKMQQNQKFDAKNLPQFTQSFDMIDQFWNIDQKIKIQFGKNLKCFQTI